MKFKALILIILTIIVLGGIFFFKDRIFNFYYDLFQKLPSIEKQANTLIEEVKKEVLTPGPLRTEKENPQSFLTKEGVIEWTNFHREKNGLSLLSENLKLNAAASIKLQDMFKKQYFEHISPSGIGAGDLAANSGYEYIIVGENLALGNFKDDKELVQAWMDSPGHRANILNHQYRDIGVAVGKGLFEGKSVWLAVQTFGLSLSVCPKPDETIKTEIELYTIKIDEIQEKIDLLLAEIKSMQPKRGPAYNEKVKEYNNLVNQYNNLARENQLLVNKYNTQVKSFNECVKR